MYLARYFKNNCTYYLLRESFPDGDLLRHRNLLDLGGDPEKFIVYSVDSSFYIENSIFERLRRTGVDADYDEVESLFLPFLDADIRDKIAPFAKRKTGGNWKPMDERTRQHIFENTHLFDRRRIHYLRFGMMNQRDLDRSPALFKILLNKSRDELEQLMLEQERRLSPDEYKSYVFTIFDLRRYFKEEFATSTPWALNSDLLDEYFFEELCHLDRDRLFWRGLERDADLLSYMVRYVVMFFDYSFPHASGWTGHEYFRTYSDAGRWGFATKKLRMPTEDAASVFGISQAELAALNKTEVTKLYRKKAQELHPDKGGEHELFIALSAAYNELLRGKTG